ncbi:MAG: transposase [Acidimicrobiia bacterium]|nr:transposase [Acidimicrobiia bacterium]
MPRDVESGSVGSSRSRHGPHEAINNLVRRIKRVAFGFRRFAHYRIRSLLYAGKLNWPERGCDLSRFAGGNCALTTNPLTLASTLSATSSSSRTSRWTVPLRRRRSRTLARRAHLGAADRASHSHRGDRVALEPPLASLEARPWPLARIYHPPGPASPPRRPQRRCDHSMLRCLIRSHSVRRWLQSGRRGTMHRSARRGLGHRAESR